MADSITTFIDPTQAPLGREPKFLGQEYIELNESTGTHGVFRGQRYLTEAWRLTNGELVVVVLDNGGTSLMNASEHIARAVKQRWASRDAEVTIIEDWNDAGSLSPLGIVISSQTGGNVPFDVELWRAKGIVFRG